MTADMVRHTATIIQFPLRDLTKRKEMRDRQAAAPVIYESGSASWYHEDAIREADETRKQ